MIFQDAVVYLIAQLIGSVFGHALVRVLIRSENISDPGRFCMNLPQVESSRAVIIEFIITFIMMCVVCAVWDPKNERFQGLVTKINYISLKIN